MSVLSVKSEKPMQVESRVIDKLKACRTPNVMPVAWEPYPSADLGVNLDFIVRDWLSRTGEFLVE